MDIPTDASAPPREAPEELVVLLDEDHRPSGVARKAEVHTRDTPLHLAFSCWLFDADGRVLLTRRALGKAAWPGVWTNAFCGHPFPGEEMTDAVRRRAERELGVGVTGLAMALPDFAYRAVDASGIVEHEVCPVFTGLIDGTLEPRPDEVMDVAWSDPAGVLDAVAGVPFAFSPWFVEQAPLLAAAVPERFTAPAVR
ncbi:isopentenyl-diphosphate Delta-isomerase [Tersicoccus sp. Bi-70]|uniref:isopentenyl-diphosphate Delta-isomerase n=1 Tax=Tersicoccus sp. Bi-70 TaxID=1897634 RepID=UPI000976B2A1|nr:isopentenyl-diphosphate Delta-isomerase [Tersicoccus sp. Bi-70]OMH32435.1 isopentenyl-diphosphate delta-isomerase [Tersicoccus sp. Bi-70]